MSCHVTGILPKADQVLDHLAKNPKAFSRAEADLIKALYPGKDVVIKQMEDDAKKYAETVAKTGARVSKYEAVSTITLKYEADMDLETAAAEVGQTPNQLREKIDVSETLRKHFGALRSAGGTVSRQIWLQAFGDLTRELRLGTLFLASLNGPTNADNTGEIDPLESRDGTANQMAFAPDGLRAVVASGDRSVRLWDVEGRRDVKRFVGHTGSVWSVAISNDGKFAISGSMDGTARVWDMSNGLQLQKYAEHSSLVSAVAFNPNGKWGISGGFDGVVAAWKVANGEELWRLEKFGAVTSLAVDPTGSYLLVAANRQVHVLELATGKTVRTHGKFASPVVSLGVSPNGKWYAAGSDDGTTRVWKLGENAADFTLTGHDGPVRSVVVKDGGKWVLTAGADGTVRLWDTAVKKEAVAVFKKHGNPVVSAAFLSNGTQTISGDRDMTVHPWKIDKFMGPRPMQPPDKIELPTPPDMIPYATP